jgi:uncharacterized protein (DUF305 family)
MKKLLAYSVTALLASIAIVELFNLGRFYRLNAAPNPHHPSASAPANQKPMMQMSDRHFIEMMIPHHQSAIAMAQLAPSRAKHSEIEQLAAFIIKAQTGEIKEMRTWYKKWYETDVPVVPAGSGMMGNHTGMMGNHAGMSGMHQTGMGMAIDLESLKTAPDFDREFIRQMIPHHQMAVHMAQMLLKHPTHPEIQNLAQSIIKSQTAKITQMQQWEKGWPQ